MKNLHFKGKFRSHQQKVLDNLNAHLKDNKLHIVAAPGAGKTTLGCDIISLDIKNPKPITTYQSLWSVFSNKKEVEDNKGEDDNPSAGKIVTSLANDIILFHTIKTLG